VTNADDGFGDFLLERKNVETGVSLESWCYWAAPKLSTGRFHWQMLMSLI